MTSFNEQHKNLSLQKIFYLHRVCIFSLSYLGGGGGIKYKKHGKDVSTLQSVFPHSLVLKLCVLWFN